MFEYPSEASLAEEETVQQDNTDGGTNRSHAPPSPSLPLALGVPPPDYLPPPVPTRALKTVSFPSLQVPDRVLLPQKLPVVRPPVPVRTTLRRSPSAPGSVASGLVSTSRNIALNPVVSSSSTVSVEKETPLASPTISSPTNKEKYYSKKKTRVSGKLESLPDPLQVPSRTLQNPNDNLDKKSDNLMSKKDSSASVARVPPAVFSKDKSRYSPFPDFYSSSIFLDSNPEYWPVYSTPISIKTSTCSTPTVGELKVKPLLPLLSEQALNCQGDKASLCTNSATGKHVLVLSDWPLGTESLV
ncbi:hypothetical protein J6590_018184 [Homalodisca vitripennis]|nr:hypothetical protein J6590_018184 [Homalodisca vitripennis]